MFYVRQKVICVNIGLIRMQSGGVSMTVSPYGALDLDRTYTVTEVGMWFDVPWCHVAEVPSPSEYGWAQVRFRPAATTSIEAFTSLLKPIKQTEDA